MELQKRNMYAVHRNYSTTNLKLLLKNRKGNALDYYALKQNQKENKATHDMQCQYC